MKAIELKKYFTEKKKNNTIGHAYLFSNVKYEDIEEIIKNICEYCFFSNSKLEFDFNPDIYLIEPEKDIIKKEKILELESNLSKTSQISDSKLYIIKECEKLNGAAANCLLKTLEEPRDNIYAFLITSNLEAVIPTIKSRCQIIKLENNTTNEADEEKIKTVLDFINMIEKYKEKSILRCNSNYRNLDKKDMKEILMLTQKFYKDCLNLKYNLKIECFEKYMDELEKVDKNNEVDKIVEKMKLLNDNINLLKYNLNINLFLDKFFIEFGRLYE